MSERIILMLDDDLIEKLRSHQENLIQNKKSCSYSQLIIFAIRDFLER